MSAILYHVVDGKVESIRVNAPDVDNLLKQGYSASPNFPTKEQADTNKTGKLSNKEIRQAAKDAGLENWEKGKLATLKEALGYEE